MGMTYVNSFQDCILACANTTGCVDISLSGGKPDPYNSLAQGVLTR